MVEIAKAFSTSEQPLRLVILDEPTSALDDRTSQQLISYLNSLQGEDLSVIYISHLLAEVLACTSRIVVLRDGRNLGILQTKEASRQTIIELMGEAKPIKEEGALGPLAPADRKEDRFANVPFVIEPALDDGEADRGDRQADGVFPVWSIAKNLTVQVYRRLRRLLLIDPKREQAVADKWKSIIDIKTDSVSRGILSLSGGNQQKVLFARCLESDSPLVLMDDPTRGVDVGTKDELYKLIIEESRKGRAFVWYTTEMTS